MSGVLLDMDDIEDIVWVLPSCGGTCGDMPAGDDEVIVPVRPGGG